MNAIIKQIQEALEHGRPLSVKTGPVAAQVLKDIQKSTPTFDKESYLNDKIDLEKKVS